MRALQILIPGWVLLQLDVGPVVQSGAAYALFVNFEAEFSHQMQGRGGGRAGARNRACVLRNLRLNQHDLYFRPI